jgi:hypothetical protein
VFLDVLHGHEAVVVLISAVAAVKDFVCVTCCYKLADA